MLVRADTSKDNDESLRSSNLKSHMQVRVGVDGFSTVIWDTYTSNYYLSMAVIGGITNFESFRPFTG